MYALDEALAEGEARIVPHIKGFRADPPGALRKHDYFFVGHRRSLLEHPKVIRHRDSIWSRALAETDPIKGNVLDAWRRIATKERFHVEVLQAVGYTVDGDAEFLEYWGWYSCLKGGLTMLESLVLAPHATGLAGGLQENVWTVCDGGKYYLNCAIEDQRHAVRRLSMDLCWDARLRSQDVSLSAHLAGAISAKARAAGVREDLVEVVGRLVDDSDGEARVRHLIEYVLKLEGEAKTNYIAHVRDQLAAAEAPAPATRKRRYEAVGSSPDGMRVRMKLLMPSAR